MLKKQQIKPITQPLSSISNTSENSMEEENCEYPQINVPKIPKQSLNSARINDLSHNAQDKELDIQFDSNGDLILQKSQNTMFELMKQEANSKIDQQTVQNINKTSTQWEMNQILGVNMKNVEQVENITNENDDYADLLQARIFDISL
ncbi:Hypothetical_protein [Hexamita inflata]|nr:Hypothetical protein HINF_LOCUS56129 [Hexamita inflata]